MRLLLDTQVWLWAISGDDRLGARARSMLSARKNQIFFSAASAWEIAIKVRLGKLTLPDEPERFVPARLVRDGIDPLLIDVRHASRVASLPDVHRDPFDRVLIAQAQIEDLPILTADPVLGEYDVTVLPASE